MSDTIIRIVYALLTSTLKWTDYSHQPSHVDCEGWMREYPVNNKTWDMDCDDDEAIYRNGWTSFWNVERPMG